MNQLRSEVHEVLGNRNMTDEKFQAVVLDEIAGIKVRRHGWLPVGPAACSRLCRLPALNSMQQAVHGMHFARKALHLTWPVVANKQPMSLTQLCCSAPACRPPGWAGPDTCTAPALASQTALAVEREERVAEDDEIVAAVNDYTRALQDGLRIIANN